MTQDDVLFGYRLQLFDLAARTTRRARVPDVRGASLDLLRVEGAGRPPRAWRCCARASAGGRRCPTSCRRSSRSGSSRFAIAHPGLGPEADRVASWRAPKWGGDRRLAQRRLQGAAPPRALHARQAPGLIAGYRAPYEPPREPAPEPHIDVDPARASWSASTASTSGACTAPRARSGSSPRSTSTPRFAWAELVRCAEPGHPTARRPAARAPRRARPAPAGWRLERVLSDNGNEFAARLRRDRRSQRSALATPASAPAAHRPTATSKRCTARSSTNAGARRSRATSTSRYTGLQTRARRLPALLQPRPRPPRPHSPKAASRADIVYGARKMEPR